MTAPLTELRERAEMARHRVERLRCEAEAEAEFRRASGRGDETPPAWAMEPLRIAERELERAEAALLRRQRRRVREIRTAPSWREEVAR